MLKSLLIFLDLIQNDKSDLPHSSHRRKPIFELQNVLATSEMLFLISVTFAEEGSKETTLMNGKQVRLASISGQPLLLSKGRYNLRKLHELPVQLIRSQRWDELKSEVLCNFYWLKTKIEVRSLR